MPISFNKIKTKHRLINPLKDFALDEMPLEIRSDPLTEKTGRVFDTGYKVDESPDLSELIQRSKEMACPFCPETLEKSTPLFPKEVIPEGRVRVGQASVIPNLLPLDKYAGISIFSNEHHIPLDGFTPRVMHDAFCAAQVYIKRILEFDPAVRYCSINWNYMPPAGSSLVHPHIQVNCGELPTNQFREQLEGCKRYYEENGTSFWQDFMEEEITLKKRYIGEIGSTFWSLSYVPLSYLPDVSCIFSQNYCITQVDKDSLSHFLKGLSRILLYLHTENIYSFNMSLLSVRKDEHFRINARISPRLLTRAIGNSDQTYSQTIHKEPYCVIPPESVCRKVTRIFFRGVLE